MAIITDHHDDNDDNQTNRPSQLPGSPSKSKPKPTSQPPSPAQPPSPNPNPFTFWFYFTLTATTLTLILTILSSTLSPPSPKQWFLSLPTPLRAHFSHGRQIKVQLSPSDPPVELFTYSKGVGPGSSVENVLIVPGLGCSSYTFKRVVDGLAKRGVFAVAVDLPGVGFSDKSVMRESGVESGGGGGIVGWVRDVYEEIQERGIFWGFDNLVENGYVPVEEIEKRREERRREKSRVSSRKVEPLELGGGEVSRVLSQVVETLGLGPVHLVLHDSALVMGGRWVVESVGVGLVRSVTLVDSGRGTVWPLWAIEVPVVREVVLGVGFVFRRLVEGCCVRKGVEVEVAAERVLLKGRDGRKAVVGMGRKLNSSFDLSEWVGMDGVKDLPMQVLWSKGWSDEWSEEGRRVAEVVSKGRLVEHSGGRWPQVTS